jgi:L-malate glycosyltransferase
VGGGERIAAAPAGLNRDLRVLFLARHLDSGGVTTHMMTLARGLAQRGWQVALASGGQTGDHPRGQAWFEENGIPHFTVPFMGPGPRGKDYLKPFASVYGLDSVIRSFRPSIVHVHWRSTSPYAAMESLFRRVPFVSTLHAESIPSGGVLRIGSRWGRGAIAVSSETKAYLMTHFGVPEDKISVVFNGADPEVFRPPGPGDRVRARQALGLGNTGPVISLVGRLEEGKGHEVLLKAARSARSRLPELQVVFAGEGSLSEGIRRLAEGLGLDDCTHFLGHVDTRPVLWASDMSVLPSFREGFGIVIVEAMLCGVPVIRTPAGGAADQIVDGETGYIVPFGDFEALSERISMLASDEGLAGAMAGAALQRARDLFTVDRMVTETERVYARAMVRPRRVSRSRASERSLS